MKNGKPKSEAPESAKAKKHESSGLKELAKRCLQFLWLDFIRNVRSTKFWIEVAALTGAFLYAGIAYEQWQAQLHGLRVDQRAWISVPSPTSYPLNGSFIPVSTQMTNTGKTPARIVEGDVAATALNKGEDFSFDFSPGHPHQRLYPVGVIFPGAPIPINITVVKYRPKSAETIIPDDAFRQDFANGKRFIIFYGRITYFDVFGVQHWTQFCSGSGDAILDNLKKCVSYNDVDHEK